jgi:hypothetical protein
MGPSSAINSLKITIITLLRIEISLLKRKGQRREGGLLGISNFFNLIFPPCREKINNFPKIKLMKIIIISHHSSNFSLPHQNLIRMIR